VPPAGQISATRDVPHFLTAAETSQVASVLDNMSDPVSTQKGSPRSSPQISESVKNALPGCISETSCVPHTVLGTSLDITQGPGTFSMAAAFGTQPDVVSGVLTDESEEQECVNMLNSEVNSDHEVSSI
jgi:hypothetical protein